MAELLIALLIVGEIATFTIPKVLAGQQTARSNAIAKEMASTIAGAWHLLSLQQGISSSTKFMDLTPYLNYVAIDTTSVIDGPPGFASLDCSNAGRNCLKFSNGSIVYSSITTIIATNTTNSIYFVVDPDGGNSGTANTGSVQFFIYPDGHLRTYGTIDAGTKAYGASYTANTAYDPTWFSW